MLNLGDSYINPKKRKHGLDRYTQFLAYDKIRAHPKLEAAKAQSRQAGLYRSLMENRSFNMADIDTDTEKETAPAEEKTRLGRRPFAFERAPERLPEVEEDHRRSNVSTGEQHGEVVFEPVERQPYIISYVCVLIPRFDTHFLRGDVVSFLHEWMQNIALSFTWKLEWTDIQLQYLQWMLSVPVTVPPASFIRVIRQQTSRQILTEFPHYTRENLSRDFWAPGHLISVGRRPHPLDTINEFIRLTRQQQGIYPPSR